MFENTVFIKPDVPFDRNDTQTCYAPMFRKRFVLDNCGQ